MKKVLVFLLAFCLFLITATALFACETAVDPSTENSDHTDDTARIYVADNVDI